MPVTPFIIEGFRGLNLAADPVELGANGATQMADVELDRRGRLRTRYGFRDLKDLVSLTAYGGLATFETAAGLRQVLVAYAAGATKKYDAYGSAGGAAVATAAPAAATFTGIARIGSPTTQALYLANGVDTVWKWSGAAFSQPAGMPAASFLTPVSTSNRLAAGSTAGGTSRVEFSGAGTPETWPGYFVDLTPGDESGLTGLTSWQQYVFAFKRRRFFVFTGEGLGPTGAPIFNYDPVDGYGALVPPVAGEEGVYFFDGRSVWLTTSGAPTCISQPIEPFLRGDVPLRQGNVGAINGASLSSVSLSYALGRLYMYVPTVSGGNVALIFDPKLGSGGEWLVYETAFPYFASLRFSGSDRESLFAFGGIGGLPAIYYQDPSTYQDFGSTPIHWVYRTGEYAVGAPEQVSVVGYTGIVGDTLESSSTITLTLATDTMTVSSGSLDMTGTDDAVGDKQVWTMLDCEGRRWQMTLAGTGASYVARTVHEVKFTRAAGNE